MIDYKIYKLNFRLNNELNRRVNFTNSASINSAFQIGIFSFNYVLTTLFVSFSIETLQTQFYNFQGKEQLREQNSPKSGTDRQSDAVENIFPDQLTDSSDDFLFPRNFKIYI